MSLFSSMKNLILWIKVDLKQELKNSVIILDNLKVHRSKAIIKFMSNEIYCFLLSLRIHKKSAHRTFFNILKKRLIKETSKNGFRLYMKEALREIREAFSLIDRQEIQKSFLKSFQTMKEIFVEANET